VPALADPPLAFVTVTLPVAASEGTVHVITDVPETDPATVDVIVAVVVELPPVMKLRMLERKLDDFVKVTVSPLVPRLVPVIVTVEPT